MALTLSSGNIVVVRTNEDYIIGTYIGTDTVTVGSTNLNTIGLNYPGILQIYNQLPFVTPSATNQATNLYPTYTIYKMAGIETNTELYILQTAIQQIFVPTTRVQNMYNDYVTNFASYIVKSPSVNITST
jgi:hypothetical protein